MKWHLLLLLDLLLIGITGMGFIFTSIPGLAWWIILASWLALWRMERGEPSRIGARLLLADSLLLCVGADYAPWRNNGTVTGLLLLLLAAHLRPVFYGPNKHPKLPWLEKPFYILGTLLWLAGGYFNDSAQALILPLPVLVLSWRNIWRRSSAGKPLWTQHLHSEIHINASPAKVWKVLLATDLYDEWNPFIHDLEGDLEPGEKLKVRIGLGDKPMTFAPKVLKVEAERELRWKGNLIVPGIFDGEHYFHLEAKDGGTRFVHGEDFSGLIAPLLTIYEQTLHGFKSMNTALKKRVEEAK